MDRYEARKAIVADLEEQGSLVKIEDHTHNVGTHDRCNTTVEPLIKQQWFVKMEELAKPAINALKTGELKFVPDVYNRQLFKAANTELKKVHVPKFEDKIIFIVDLSLIHILTHVMK